MADAFTVDEKLRIIGSQVCRHANAGCLCFERDKPLCENVLKRAKLIYETISAMEKPPTVPGRPKAPPRGAKGKR